jgi:hypothetical protein
MSSATIETTLEISGIELDVSIEIEGCYSDHGIGSYEYWGARNVHHDWGWDDIALASVSYDPADIAQSLRKLHSVGNRKRFRKRLRQVRKQVELGIDRTAEHWVEDNSDSCVEALNQQNEPVEDELPRRRYYGMAA